MGTPSIGVALLASMLWLGLALPANSGGPQAVESIPFEASAEGTPPVSTPPGQRLPSPPDFDRDVRPILASRCFACHGPDAGSRKAGLRLDTEDGARSVLTPGSPGQSELYRRVTSPDPDLRMPPPDTPGGHGTPLDPASTQVLRAWIEDGAPWARHWAFAPPVAAELPDPGVHPIDAFIERRLGQEGLDLAPPAEVHTLARRLSFDLVGLPPEPDRVAALGPNPSDADWNAYIDELLDSPHHGERLAHWWLDGARYADTDGFQADATRTNWPWRDWVVEAFQQDMPFDEFTRLQFAGDLLPGAGEDEVLATCFHRNHMHNGEGGRDPEESRVDYVRDRVNTVGTVWLGLTLSCAQCHDHKFDPISQADYYSLTAYFDSIDESGRAGGQATPFLTLRSDRVAGPLGVATEEARVAQERVDRLRERAGPGFSRWFEVQSRRVEGGFQAWRPWIPGSVAAAEGSSLEVDPDGTVRCTTGDAIQEDYVLELVDPGLERVTGFRIEVLVEQPGGLAYTDDGEFILTNVKAQVVGPDPRDVRDLELAGAVASVEGVGVDKQYGPVVGVLDDDPRTGWTTRTRTVAGQTELVIALGEPLHLGSDERVQMRLMHRSTVPKAHIRRFRIAATDQRSSAVRGLGPMPLEELADLGGAPSLDSLPPELAERLLDQFLEDDPTYQDAELRSKRLEAQRAALGTAAGDLRVTVLRERAEPRVTAILERGVWDQRGPPVERGLPGALLSEEVTPAASRLDLANWITSRSHPLTARVLVNQIWQLHFGAGIVRTPADFGIQGARPTHPELLDWLAVDFMEHGWSLRHLVRRIVTSRTYRQSSRVDGALLDRDPENLLLARGPRFRLPSWMIRDAALAASGLLDRTLGGPPVFPYQPPGVWSDPFMGRFEYRPTLGQARHRRTLYSFWRRNIAPTFLFDQADRRTCEVVRRNTNTPLQALTLLNDRSYREAAQALAESTLGEWGASRAADAPDGMVQRMALRVLTRRLEPEELAPLLELQREVREAFELDPVAAREFTRPSPQAVLPVPSDLDPIVLASWVPIAQLLLNLDEAITHG